MKMAIKSLIFDRFSIFKKENEAENKPYPYIMVKKIWRGPFPSNARADEKLKTFFVKPYQSQLYIFFVLKMTVQQM